jgi:hypothetical protein
MVEIEVGCQLPHPICIALFSSVTTENAKMQSYRDCLQTTKNARINVLIFRTDGSQAGRKVVARQTVERRLCSFFSRLDLSSIHDFCFLLYVKTDESGYENHAFRQIILIFIVGVCFLLRVLSKLQDKTLVCNN